MLDNNMLICYNGFTLLADHGMDLSRDYYRSAGVERLHNFDTFVPENVKLNELVFVKTDFLDKFVQDVLPKINCSFRLISCVSALQPNSKTALEIVECDKIEKWFCTNPPDVESAKIIPIPIGFEEPSRLGGDQTLLNYLHANSIAFEAKKDMLFLPYHTLSTNSERKKHYDYLEDLLFVDTQESKVDIATYLMTMNQYKFIICLEGYGFDTHRNYEALLMGAVPIMKDTAVKDIFDFYKLPGIFVNSWEEVDEEFYLDISKRTFDFSNVENFLRVANYNNLFRR